MHFFGSERGLLATPTQCGTYPVSSTSNHGTGRSPTRPPPSSSISTRAPAGPPAPARRGLSTPAFTAGRSDNTAGAHTPLLIDLTRTDGDRTSTPSKSRPRPDSSPPLAGSLTARTPPSPQRQPQLLRASRRRRAQLPRGLPGRHLSHRRGRRHPSGLSPGQGLPRRALQRRSALPRGDHPGGLGPL